MTDRGVAIVTGGGCGIGLAIAKALLGDGWRLATADLAPGPLDAARTQSEPVRANAAKCVVIDVANRHWLRYPVLRTSVGPVETPLVQALQTDRMRAE